MIRMRVISRLIFGLGLLAFAAGAIHAADGDKLTDAEKRHIVAEKVEAAADAKTREEIAGAMPGLHEGEHAAAGHGESSNNPLEFKKDLAFFTAVVFVVLLLVLWKFAWGPISSSLDRRERAVARQISDAAASNEEAKRLLAQYGEKLDRAKEEVRAIFERARRDAEAAGREILAEAKQDAEGEHRRAVREIDAATADALKTLAERSAEMAVELAGKIVGSELRAADHARLVEQAVSQFAAADSSKPR